MTIRERLFQGLDDFTLYRETTDAEIESIITPESKRGPSDPSVDYGYETETPVSNVMKAVEHLESRDLIADGSRDYTLPTILGKHSDLASITPETMADVVTGKYSDKFGKVTIVDCRYPYEFEGGHIHSAVNMYTKDEVHTLLKTHATSENPHILIFHCEFSSERGPKMYRFLRSQDRAMNKDHYPQLTFPEVYLLDGGYKAFFMSHKLYSKQIKVKHSLILHDKFLLYVNLSANDALQIANKQKKILFIQLINTNSLLMQELCDPISYKPMLHEDNAADLLHFRVKSKSWTEGCTHHPDRQQKSRSNRNLSF